MTFHILLSLLLTSGWVAAWLYWLFDGEIRQFIFAKLVPKSWLGESDGDDIIFLNRKEFDQFLNLESQAPLFVMGLATCPGCMSAYLSAASTFLCYLALPLPLLVAPLVWAAGAYIGHRIHHHA